MAENINTTGNAPGFRWVVLFCNFIVLAIGYTGVGIWAVALPELEETFQLNNTMIQLGSAVFMAGYAIGSVCMVAIAERFGYKIACAVGLIFFSISCFVIPVAPNYGIVILFRFIQGWGIIWVTGTSMCTDWFPYTQKGLAAGVASGGLACGLGAGGLIITEMMEAFGTWQVCFRIFGMVSLGITIVWFLIVKNPPKDLYGASAEATIVNEKLKGKSVWQLKVSWILAFALFANVWSTVVFAQIAPDHVYNYGFTASDISLALLLKGLIGITAPPVGGILCDRFISRGGNPLQVRSKVMAYAGFAISAAALLLWPFFAIQGVFIMCVLAVFVGYGSTLTNSPSATLPMDLMKDTNLANKLFGFTVLTGIGLSGIIGPILLTAIANQFGWTVCYIASAIPPIIAIFTSLSIPKMEMKTDE